MDLSRCILKYCVQGVLLVENVNKTALLDFASERKVDGNTIHKYINRHPEEFEGHVFKVKNKLVLDDVAIRILDKVYPVPVVEVVMDEESRRKAEEAKDAMLILVDRYDKKIDALQNELVKKEEEKNQLMTEHKKELEQQADKLEAKHQLEKEELKSIYKEQIELLQSELDKERSKGFLARLFGK